MSESSHRQPAPKKTVKSPGPDTGETTPPKTRRRPSGPRGQLKRDLILDTAAALLVEGGAEALNTNILAERAGISVGSVYQYFSNKEAILTALGERYLQRSLGNTLAALRQDVSGLDFATMVERVIDPMIAFEREHPAFRHLDVGSEGEGSLAGAAERIDREILATIHDLLLRVRPDLAPVRARQIARVTKALYKGMSYLVGREKEIEKEGGDVERSIAEMKRMMVDYLEDCLG